MRTHLIVIGLITAAWASSAQANPIVQVIGGVVGAVIAKHNQPKIGSCTLYDRGGNPVVVSCPADVAAASDNMAAPPPAPYGAPPELTGGPPPPDAYDDAPRQYAEADCGCAEDRHGPAYRQDYRDARADAPRAAYDSYEQSSERVGGYYEQSGYASGQLGGYDGGYYGDGLAGGVGHGGGYYSYGGGVGYGDTGYGYAYGAGGHAGDGYGYGYGYGARVAGRDAAGFLTWPGKR